jgi:hypothetical protein
MSQTIMMPSSFDQAVKEMCAIAVSQAVAALAEKHGFDQEEALRDLNLGDLKIVRKRGPSPKSSPVTKKAKTAAKDGSPKTKRAKTGYLLFADKIRPTVKAELEAELEEGAKLKPQATVREIAKRWKALTDDERADWNAQAKELAAPVFAPVAAVAEPEPEPEQGATDEEEALGEDDE